MKKLYLLTIILILLASLLGCTTRTPIETIDAEKTSSLELQIEEQKQEIKVLTVTNEFLVEENAQLNEEIEFIFDDLMKLKGKYQYEYELRNVLDIKVHSILKAMAEADLAFLESIVAQKVTVYENYLLSDFERWQETFDFPTEILNVRQRWFYLGEDKDVFTSGYEILAHDTERINLLNFEFIFEESEWRLNSIRTE